MKIKELVSESGIRKGTQSALPNLESFPSLDNNSCPYLAYRFGMELAGSPDVDVDKQGGTGSEFTTIGYSDADQKIIDHAKKRFGIKGKPHGGNGSTEIDSVNKISPTAKLKRNKYGV